MSEFDRTESSYIENKIEQEKTALELGRVARVFEHTEADDDSNHEVNVILRDEDKERRRVPIMNNTPGSIQPPTKGDMVVVGFLDGTGEAPVVLGQLYNAEQRALLGEENIYRLRRGDLYFEAHPDGDWMRMAQKPADDAEPTSEVELHSNGDITINGNRVRIKDSEQTIQLTQSSDLAEGGANTHDYNTDNWTVVPWDTQTGIADDSYNFTGNGIEIMESGTYEVYTNLYYRTPSQSNRLSVTMRFTKNGNPLIGQSGDGFVSGQSDHKESSTNHKQIYEFEDGDVIRVETIREAATGELNPVANQGLFQIQRLQR